MKKYFDTYRQLRDCILADRFRYLGDHGKYSVADLMRLYLRTPAYRYIYWMRLASYCIGRPLLLPIKIWAMLRLQHLRNITGIQISPSTQIGKGFYIGHFGSIVVNPCVRIGENVDIIQTCTIGIAYRGEKGGAPTIGDKVYIGAGSRIFGNIQIGNNVAIGANAVVTHDAPDNAVLAGVPAQIISMKGVEGYIFNTIEDEKYIPRFQ